MDIPDGDLVRLARDGDSVAFRLLVERYQPVARARAARLGNDRHEVDDIVQESFLQAFISLQQLRDPDRFGSWLGGIVLNVHRTLRRRAPLTLLADWPEGLHPVSTDGLPSADDLDRADALRAAVADLPPGQRQAVAMFYYADRPASQIAASPGAAKASLHKARRRLRAYISAHRPDLIPAATRRTPMTAVRIAHAEPLPGRHSRSELYSFDQILVVLADDAAGRALPVWLPDSDGESLWRLLDPPAGGAGTTDVPPEQPGEALTVQLLGAAGVTVTAVDIDELGPEVTAARIGLAGPTGTQQVLGRLGHGLALAVAAGVPVRVAARLMDRVAVPASGDDLLRPFLGEGTQPSPGRSWRRRFEPRNLGFDDGLDRWDFGGTFRRAAQGGGRGQPEAGGSHWQDFACAAGDRSAVLLSAVPEPYGTAFLRQAVFADDYRGTTVTFRAEIRTSDLAGEAGLGLWVAGASAGAAVAAGPDESEPGTVAVTGTTGWAAHEVTAEVPGDAEFVRFGVFLTGPGRVELRAASVTAVPRGQPSA